MQRDKARFKIPKRNGNMTHARSALVDLLEKEGISVKRIFQKETSHFYEFTVYANRVGEQTKKLVEESNKEGEETNVEQRADS